MNKMLRITLCLLMATAFAVQAQVILNEDFSGYGDGNVTNNAGWVSSPGSTWNIVGGELVMAREALGNGLMFTTGTSVVAGETMVVTMDLRYRIPNDRTHARIMSFGVQTNGVAATGGLQTKVSGFNHFFGLELSRESGEIRFTPEEYQWWTGQGGMGYTLRAFEDCGFNPFGYDTNSGTDIATVDPDSDVLHLVYSITKSHVTNQFYVSCSTSNLTSGVQWDSATELIERTDAWAGSDYYFFVGANPEGDTDFTNYIQNVKMELFEPVVAPPATISALALDSEIQVSWAVVPGATYDLYSSLSSGSGFSLLQSDLTTESYLHSPLPNGVTQYYYVIAKLSSGDSGPSAVASGTPQGIYKNQLVYSTDFSTNALGDLTADAKWSEISGSSNNAFWVIDDGGTKKADTVATESYYTNSVGNGVYLDLLIRNDADDVVEGYFDVVLTATADGTNDADHTHSSIISWGLTGSTSESPDVGKATMALFALGVRAESRMCLMFGNDQATASSDSLVLMSYAEMGWNPKPNWAGGIWGGDVNAPRDLETDPLRVTWKIRKTREDGVYQAWASVSNLNTFLSYEGTLDLDTRARQDIYDSPAALFSLAHYWRAHQDENYTTLHATIDELSITHASGAEPEVIAPTVTTILEGDREVIISWDPVLEATGGYTLTLETPSAEVYTLATNITETTYTDSPRWNDIANTYTLTANFDSDLSPDTASTNFAASPVGLVSVYQVSEAFGTINLNDAQVPATNNGTTWAWIDAMETPFFENGVGGYTGPSIYGLLAGRDDDLAVNARIQSNGQRMNFRLPTSGWSNFPWGNMLAFIEVTDMGTNTTFDVSADTLYLKARWGSWTTGNNGDANNGIRIAIRNGAEWYVSDLHKVMQDSTAGDQHELIIPDVAGETWYPIQTSVPDSEMLALPPSGGVAGSTFTDVNAIGWFQGRGWSMTIWELDVKKLGALGSYDYWAANSGLVSSNSAATIDADGDGILNKDEYAFDGDPLVADTAELPTIVIDTASTGSDFVTVTYKKQRDPVGELTYSLESTADLLMPWSPVAGATEGVIDYYWMGVTNQVPYNGAIDAEFYKVNVDGL